MSIIAIIFILLAEIAYMAVVCYVCGLHKSKMVKCRGEFIKIILNSSPKKSRENDHQMILKLHQMDFNYSAFNCFTLDYKLFKMVISVFYNLKK